MHYTLILNCKKQALERSSMIASKYLQQVSRTVFTGRLCQTGYDNLLEELNNIASKNSSIDIYQSGKSLKHKRHIGRHASSVSEGYPFKIRTLNHTGFTSYYFSVTRIAALLHDIGKAIIAFQESLVNKGQQSVYHSLGSALLVWKAFEYARSRSSDPKAFLSFLSDIESLRESFNYAADHLSNLSVSELDTLAIELGRSLSSDTFSHCFATYFSKTITWLCLTHHELPKGTVNAIDLSNSVNLEGQPVSFSPVKCLWKKKRKNTYLAYLKNEFLALLEAGIFPTEDKNGWIAITNLCRPSLVLGDFSFSSQKTECTVQDSDVFDYANTVSNEVYGQTLEEHLIGVKSEASRYFNTLIAGQPTDYIHPLSRSAFIKRELSQSTQSKFEWQKTALQATVDSTIDTAMFSVLISGTGCGKTRAASAIMQAASSKPSFDVALNMRCLTTQTYHEYTKKLNIPEAKVNMLVGESIEDIDSEEPKGQSTRNNDWMDCAINIMTIDHLSSGINKRRNVHLPTIQRMTSSDIVIDEIDSFDVTHLKALGYLIFIYGYFGRKVVLSSATVNEQYLEFLYNSFTHGLVARASMTGVVTPFRLGLFSEFAEFNCVQEHSTNDIKIPLDEIKNHSQRISDKVDNRQIKAGKLSIIKTKDKDAIFKQIIDSCSLLHSNNKVIDGNGHEFSCGAVKLNNIETVKSLAKYIDLNNNGKYNIKYITYHSKLDLSTKLFYEEWLSRNLDRSKDPSKISKSKEYQNIVKDDKRPTLFLVISTSIIEIGRDFDFDWGICEPLTTYGLIQFAGRILRHRQVVPTSHNLLILSDTIRSALDLENKYSYPGIETESKSNCYKPAPLFPVSSMLNRKMIKMSLSYLGVNIAPICKELVSDKLIENISAKSTLLNSNANAHLTKIENLRYCYHINKESLWKWGGNSSFAEVEPSSSVLAPTFNHLLNSEWYKTNAFRASDKQVVIYSNNNGDSWHYDSGIGIATVKVKVTSRVSNCIFSGISLLDMHREIAKKYTSSVPLLSFKARIPSSNIDTPNTFNINEHLGVELL